MKRDSPLGDGCVCVLRRRLRLNSAQGTSSSSPRLCCQIFAEYVCEYDGTNVADLLVQESVRDQVLAIYVQSPSFNKVGRVE